MEYRHDETQTGWNIDMMEHRQGNIDIMEHRQGNIDMMEHRQGK